MKSLSNIIFLFALFIISHIGNGFSSPKPHDQQIDHHFDDKEGMSSSWFMNNYKHKGHEKDDEVFNRYRPNAGRLTCDRYPRVCHVRGSAGPDCCKKKCVNVKSDRLNCGMCGNKCKYPEVCCKGRCVNPLHDRKNCGQCGNKCRRGSFCDYGMCSYA